MRKPGVGAVKKKQNRSFFSFKYHLAEEGGGFDTLLIQSTYCTFKIKQNKTKTEKKRKNKQGFKSESQTPPDACMQLPRKGLIPNAGQSTGLESEGHCAGTSRLYTAA